MNLRLCLRRNKGKIVLDNIGVKCYTYRCREINPIRNKGIKGQTALKTLGLIGINRWGRYGYTYFAGK
jgi:hypothetical protein